MAFGIWLWICTIDDVLMLGGKEHIKVCLILLILLTVYIFDEFVNNDSQHFPLKS